MKNRQNQRKNTHIYRSNTPTEKNPKSLIKKRSHRSLNRPPKTNKDQLKTLQKVRIIKKIKSKPPLTNTEK